MSASISPNVLSSFNPPASCFTQIWGSQGVSATTYGLLQGDPDNTACKPAGYNTATIYSPAVCPSSYYGGATYVSLDGTATETVVMCCPSQFSLDGGVYGCVSSFSAALSTVLYTYSTDGSAAMGTKSLSSNGDRGWNAHSLQVRFQSTDIITSSATTTTDAQISATSSSSSGTLTSSTSTTSNVESGSTDSIVESSPGTSSGLSTGAKAGIAIGAVLGGIAFIALIVWLVWRKKHQQRPKGRAELVADEQSGAQPDTTPRHEIDSWTGRGGFPDGGKEPLRPTVDRKSALTPPSELEAPPHS